MKHTPLLLGAEDGMFALAIGDIQTALTLGAVLLVFGAVVESPVWTKLAAGLERVGVPSILVEMPGHGLNGNATIDAREVVARARRALTEAGLEKVVVITESAGMEPAAAAASTDSDIVELIVAGLPLPDVATKLARNVGALDYMRRGVRLSAIKSL
ncbi:MAG TPA: hypothetical protein VFT85_05575, partial [Acidimicrobiia bacterium]|nr:hypothetical protein [Acidimicrobiia bacterium]